jgi:hypothetical protein
MGIVVGIVAAIGLVGLVWALMEDRATTRRLDRTREDWPGVD